MSARVAAGLRQLADMVEDGILEGQEFPGQAQVVSVLMSSAEDVGEIAEKYGVEVETNGRGYIRAEIELGTGAKPKSRIPVYRSAVIVEFWHLPRKGPAIRPAEVIEAAA